MSPPITALAGPPAQQRSTFLQAHGIDGKEAVALPGDASARRYYRLAAHGLLLMAEVPGAPDLKAFVTISRYLTALGLSAPQVRAVDYDQGLALIEDFGDQTFTRLLALGHSEEADLYSLAVKALVHLHTQADALPPVPAYDAGPLLAELEMFTGWYVPACAPGLDAVAFARVFLARWQERLADLAQCRDVLVLRDFHVDNLMVIDGRSGAAACGLLDFQDGVLGSPAYDLMSLAQDARRDLAPGLEERLISHYLARRPGLDRAAFRTAYWLLAAHRHTKILGNFERLSKRDGKHGYLAFIPRVQRQLDLALTRAGLDDIRALMDRHVPAWASHKPVAPGHGDDQQKGRTP